MKSSRLHDPHPVFVGREEELENLLGVITSALSGEGSCVILSGEAGIGKSRLIEEVINRAYTAGFVTFEGQCRAETRSPYIGFKDIFRSICSLERSSVGHDHSAQRSEEKGNARAIRLLDDLISGRLDEWRTDPRIKGDRIRYATLDLVRSIARTRPALIVVEDLQWADASTMDLFQVLARNCKDARVVLIGSYRTEEMENTDQVPAKIILDRMVKESLTREMELNRLTNDDIIAMIPSLFGNAVDRLVYNLIETGSEGNPLLVVELTRNLAESRAIVEVDEYWMVDPSKIVDNLPSSLDDLLMDMLRKLNWVEGRTIEVASMIGMDIDPELLACVMGSTRVEIDEILKDISSKTGLLVMTFHGFQFRHNKIREILHNRIPEPLGKELHLALAESLERLHHDVDREEELAWHYSYTGNNEKCVEYSLASADRMLSTYALDDALRLYRTAILKLEGSAGNIGPFRRALEGAGVCLEEMGEYDKAAEMFNEYLETGPLADDRSRVLLRMIECWGPSRLGLGSLEHEKRLMDYLSDIGPVSGTNLAKMHDLMANVDIWDKKYEDAVEHRVQAENIYLEHGQMEKYALDLSFHAYTLLSLEKLDEADNNISTALSIFQDHPYNYGIMDAEMCSGEILMYLGRDDESLVHFEKSAKIATEIGEHIMEYWIRCYISIQQMEIQNDEAARSSLRRAEQVARLTPSRFAQGGPMAFQAYLEAKTGHAERAIALAEAALKILEEYDFPRIQRAMALIGYAKALYAQGDIQTALHRFDLALNEIRGCPTSTIFEARAYWWLANSMMDQGNNADARTMMERARPLFARIDNFRMTRTIDHTLQKISLSESMRSNVIRS